GPLASIGIIVALLTLAFTVNTGFPLTLILELAGFEPAARAVEDYTLSGMVERIFSIVGDAVRGLLGEGIMASLIVEGVLGGVGAVLTFLPLIAIVSAGYAILDDSGLLPRIAVGVHRALSTAGLSGHTVFPMITSFGCNVPGILAARTVLNPWERLKLILTLPFIPCQARLVVLLALAVGMGPLGGLYVILSYLIALTTFIILNILLDKISRRKRDVEILLELPAVHAPFLRVIWWTTWSHVKHFLARAGTIILAASIIIWFLTSFDTSLNHTTEITESIAGKLAALVSPTLSPLGLEGAQAIVIALSLIVGFIAKELVIATLIVATGAETIPEAISSLGLAPAQIAPLMVFITLYIPCLATLATIYMESGSAKLALSVAALMLTIAYIVSLLTYIVLQAF
ncbi:MAG: nucleoside recognition domain-containing protein, partial [Acidilobaceae archaeon]